jgi:hypothetical protein
MFFDFRIDKEACERGQVRNYESTSMEFCTPMNIPTMTPPVTASGAITPLEIVAGCVDTGAPATVEALEP